MCEGSRISYCPMTRGEQWTYPRCHICRVNTENIANENVRHVFEMSLRLGDTIVNTVCTALFSPPRRNMTSFSIIVHK